jgi:hypothetical protein
VRKEKSAFMNNIQQKILNFKLKITSDCITPKAGLVLFVKIAEQIGLTDLIKIYFSKPGSNKGIRAYDYIMSIMLMLIGGGKYLEDIREIRMDKGLQKLSGIKRVPSPDAIAKWLRKEENAIGLKRMIGYLNKEVLKRDIGNEYTLDVDATIIETEKNDATMTYKGIKGNSVLLSFIPEVDLCMREDYREGSVNAGYKILEHIKYVNTFLSKIKKRVKYFRSDSAAYNSEIINYCNENNIKFTITADMDSSIKSSIKQIKESEWRPLYDKYGILTERQYATTVHCMNNTKEAFTIIVQRWEDKQGCLFDEYKYKYYVIATNEYEKDPQEIIYFHNARGNSENYNKELKSGFGLEHVSTQDIFANAIFFKLGILAYNLFIALKRLVLGGDWIKKTISTLRWQLIFIAAKVVFHSRLLFLKLKSSYFYLFNSILSKIPSALAPPIS